MKPDILAIDVGNSRIKIARFDPQGQLLHSQVLAHASAPDQFGGLIEQWSPKLQLKVGWLSSSQAQDWASLTCWQHFDTVPQFFQIGPETSLPIVNRYQSPETLGTDRITGVIGACNLFPGHPVLVLDIGTAITYDVANAAAEYLGGGISPGLHMRFQALHVFTARLPEATPRPDAPLIGRHTEESLQAGVVHGLRAELAGMIDRYQAALGPGLKVVLTGGDAPFFENHLKNVNFADAYLVLRGIYHILKHLSSI